LKNITSVTKRIILSLIAILFFTNMNAQTIYHVSTTGNDANAGTTWGTAYRNLTKALASAKASAAPEVQIWVAAGTYKPTEGMGLSATDRTASFELYRGNGVGKALKVYGGFAGGESNISQRNITDNESTLSGDLSASPSDGSYHVVVIANIHQSADSIVIDGLTIRDGYSNSVSGSTIHNGISLPNNMGGSMIITSCLNGKKTAVRNCMLTSSYALTGGGLYCAGANSIFQNCQFTYNSADAYGGGCFVDNCQPWFTNCIFQLCSAGLGGGGLYLAQADSRIEGCLFSSCTTDHYGAGLYADYCDPNVSNSKFRNNTALNAGAGVYTKGATAYLLNCDFRNNKASAGGGAFASNFGCTDTLINCVMANNKSTQAFGGAVSIAALSSAYIANCRIDSNTAPNAGGGIMIEESSMILNKTSFKDNIATSGKGGAIHVNIGKGNISGCNFLNNTAQSGGAIWAFQALLNVTSTVFLNNALTSTGNGAGAVYTESDSAVNVVNCTFFGNEGNTAGGIAKVGSGLINIRNTIFYGNTGILSSYPELYADAPKSISYSLMQTGAQFCANCLIPVNASGPNSYPPAFTNLNNPLGADGILGTADDGLKPGAATAYMYQDLRNIGNNSFLPSGTIIDAAGTARISGGTVDIGAYEGDGCLMSALYVNKAVGASGDGQSWGSAFKELSEAMDVAATCGSVQSIWVAAGNYKPTSGTDRTVSFNLRNNLSILGGFAGGEGSASQRNTSANQTILSGDIGSTGIASDNSFHVVKADGVDNTAIIDGFIIRDGNCNGNIGNAGGGGMYNVGASPIIGNCIFINNIASTGGGAYNIAGSSPSFRNCIFSGNSASGTGGALCDEGSSSSITNCTIASNNGSGGTGGVSISQSNTHISNTILWANTGSSGNNIVSVSSAPIVSYNTVQGGFAGTSNSSADPQFSNAADLNGVDNKWGTADDGLKLQMASPAVNTGNNTLLPASVTLDITGSSRIQNTTVDQGAYETFVGVLVAYYADADGDGYGDPAIDSASYTPMPGFVTNSTDCNDANPSANALVMYYTDADQDGFGSAVSTYLCASTAPLGYSINNTDCNDADAQVHVPVTYYPDADGDGFGSALGSVMVLCVSTAPLGYAANNTDCDDNDASAHDVHFYFVDADFDGFGSNTVVMICSATIPPGYATNNTDCNDNNASVNSPSIYYVDADGDGYGSTTEALMCSAVAPAGYAANSADCNDADASVHVPVVYYLDADGDGYGSASAASFCTMIIPAGYAANNNDCNDADASLNVPQLYYVDADGDGYGSTTEAMLCSIVRPSGFSTNHTDCNDADALLYEPLPYFADLDGDGYGSGVTIFLCSLTAPAGYATNSEDCHDLDETINPAAQEICGNGIDENCNGMLDDVCPCSKAPGKPFPIIMPDDRKICPGDTRSFFTNATGAISYQWQPPAGGTILYGQGTPFITVSFDSSFIASSIITVNAINPCGTSSTQRRRVLRGLAPGLPSAITGEPYGVCTLTEVPYSVVYKDNVNYIWSFSNALGTVSSGQGANAITASFGSDLQSTFVQVAASNGCGVSATRKKVVTARPAQPAPITGSAIVCAGATEIAYITNSVVGATSYEWLAPAKATIYDGTLSSTMNTLATPSDSVMINFGSKSGYVKVRAVNACGISPYRAMYVTADCTAFGKTVAKEEIESIQLYPSPAHDLLNVAFKSKDESEYNVAVTNALGQVVIQRTLQAIKGDNKFSLDVSGLAQGVYFLSLSTVTDGGLFQTGEFTTK
jgi:hypothetical protein